MKEKLPNQLTMARIFMIPIFVILFYLPEGAHFNGFVSQDHSSVMWVIAAIVFAVASFTDWLDGYLARKWHVVSNFGKFADPLADKMLNMVAFVVLVGLHVVPMWLLQLSFAVSLRLQDCASYSLNKVELLWRLQCLVKSKLPHKC